MLNEITHSDIEAVRGRYQVRKDTLIAEIERIESDLAALDRVIEIFRNEREPTNGHRRVVTVKDIENCKTQLDIARRYAQLNDGVVKIAEVAKLAHETERWGAKLGSMQSTFHNYLTRRPAEWEWVEPGTFRWLLFDA